MPKLIIINIEIIICNNGYLLVAYTFLLRVGCLYIIHGIYTWKHRHGRAWEMAQALAYLMVSCRSAVKSRGKGRVSCTDIFA